MIRTSPSRGLAWTLLTALIAFVVVPVVGLPYAADDLANRTLALASFGDQWETIRELNVQWMELQGRFFPGGSLYGFAVWNLFDSRAAYTVFLALLGLACILLLALAVWRATRSTLVAATTVLAIGSCWQFRFVYLDGLTSFAGLVIYTVALTIGSGLLAARILHGGSRWLALPLAVVWTLAITAYEVSLLMLPALAIVLVATAPRVRERAPWLWAGLPLIIPAFAEIVVTLVLRAGASGTASAYDVNLAGPVGTTFLKQLVAPLPFSQQVLAGAPLNATVAVMLALALAVPTALAWRPWRVPAMSIPDRLAGALVAAGVWAWMVPACLAAVTQRWQDELVWGQGYIYVAYQFAGLALVVAGLASLARTRADGPWARHALVVGFAVLAVACAVSAASNLTVLSAFIPGPQGPA